MAAARDADHAFLYADGPVLVARFDYEVEEAGVFIDVSDIVADAAVLHRFPQGPAADGAVHLDP